ncbi:MAG: ergothioneine biosynthesis protein EgtB [Candidatus Lambdaproteobacteria bacterium]|nr:ergothioneine biosynthesis protein EgtB [Candidatus Lambdaproteobacteria bacterium]
MASDARVRTLELVRDLDEVQMFGPRLGTVNPPCWEIGHVAFFWEVFCLRQLGEEGALLPGGEELYDSFLVAHDDRWELALPDRAGTEAYMQRVLERVLGRLGARTTPRESYLYQLCTQHEDMHGEALAWTRQTHGYPTPPIEVTAAPAAAVPSPTEQEASSGNAAIPGGEFQLGAMPDEPFLFDNEKWAHPVAVAPFRMARTPVTNAQFADFVAEGGYDRDELWGYQGRLWRRRAAAEHPRYWRREGDAWLVRRFDRWLPLAPREPVIHVNWHEANAWCAWAGRRLPSEAEWELAAGAEPTPDGRGLSGRKRRYPWGDEPPTPARANTDMSAGGPVDVAAHPAGDSAFGCRQMLGNVWEWTASPFYPFPGFVLDEPYREYSAPWFGYHKVLRGGSWVARSRVLRNTYRNFALPDRGDIFAGFRTCARDEG